VLIAESSTIDLIKPDRYTEKSQFHPFKDGGHQIIVVAFHAEGNHWIIGYINAQKRTIETCDPLHEESTRNAAIKAVRNFTKALC
jgi:hypothetical protein